MGRRGALVLRALTERQSSIINHKSSIHFSPCGTRAGAHNDRCQFRGRNSHHIPPTTSAFIAMTEQPRVILSGFADEAANQKTAVQQFAAFAAMGLQYYSIRFIDIGGGVKNVMKLTNSEI